MSILLKPVSAEAETSDGQSAQQNAQRTASSDGDRRQGDRRENDRRQGDRREGDRRALDRRGMDNLRSELQWTQAREADQQGLAAAFSGALRGFKKKPARFIVLLVALLSGGLAAALVSQRNQQVAPVAAQTVTEIVPAKKARILVAKKTIGVGQKVSSASLGWEDWPEESVRNDYITIEAAPKAIDEMAGSVARYEIFPGEPIREQKLATASQGTLSAVLGSGMRGVSVSVGAESASGGFINPNDRVDVVLTRTSRSSSSDEISATGRQSQTILHNVRVLAINSRFGEMGNDEAQKKDDEQSAANFSNIAIATLELDTAEAEVLINATTIGQLSLVLRSAADIANNDKAERNGTNQAIRISSPFWTK